jgi:hypothetical protein
MDRLIRKTTLSFTRFKSIFGAPDRLAMAEPETPTL